MNREAIRILNRVVPTNIHNRSHFGICVVFFRMRITSVLFSLLPKHYIWSFVKEGHFEIILLCLLYENKNEAQHYIYGRNKRKQINSNK